MEIKRIMVIGAGFMGSGIAQVMAAAGYDVVLMDVADGFVRKGMAAIEKNLAGSVAKGKLAEADKAATLGRIIATTDLALAKDCDLVIEAIIENKQAKMDLYRQLEEICPPPCPFCQQHLVYSDYGTGDGDEAAGSVCGHALLQPRTRHETGGDHPGAQDGGCDGPGHQGTHRADRKGRRARQGRTGVPGEPGQCGAAQ